MRLRSVPVPPSTTSGLGPTAIPPSSASVAPEATVTGRIVLPRALACLSCNVP